MPTQDNRLIAIDTPLGKDVLLLQSFVGTEGMSRLFRFDLDLLSENDSISFKQIVGQRVTIRLSSDAGDRFFNGFVSRFAQSYRDDRFAYYHAEVVPWLWFLTRKADCRVFQDKTVPEIVTSLFDELSFPDHAERLSGTYEPRNYCVQYRETNFNFVSRLLEEYGISYYFKHEQGKHTLVLADSPNAYDDCPLQSTLNYSHEEIGAAPGDTAVEAWEIRQEFKPGKYALADYNFETPSTDLLATVDSTVKVAGNDAFEVFDHPGEFLKQDEGDRLVRVRMEEEEAQHLVVSGKSSCRSLISGHAFELDGHYRLDMNQKYTLTAVSHSASVGATYQTGEGEAEVYSNSFTSIVHTTPFRPPRTTPNPVVSGVQSAVVVGPAGEEIFVDKYSRVKVQFHWDRKGKKDEKSSCFVRVSQPWAGKNWGMIMIPRIGQEVLVDFLEGDPDQPIITGRVYNAEQMPPYELPANMTQAGVKTRSTKGGSVDNANEIRFEDKKGSEVLLVHAEKEYQLEVEADETHSVGHDRKKTIDNDETSKIKGHQKITVDVDRTLDVNGNFDETIGKYKKETVTGSVTQTFKDTFTQEISGAVKIHAAKSYELTVDGDLTIKVLGKVDITGLSGHSHVEPKKEDTCAEKEESHGFKHEYTGIKMEETGMAVEETGVKVETTLTEVSTAITKIEGPALWAKEVELEMHKSGIGIHKFSIDIKNAGMKIIT
jgi:type VI secretion system secreted protein VgrG